MPGYRRYFLILIILSLVVISCKPVANNIVQTESTNQPTAAIYPTQGADASTPATVKSSQSLTVQQERLFSFLEQLTSIRAYAGWRLSASQGELDGLKYVEQEMKGLSWLNSFGAGYEWQEFHVPISMQIHAISLSVKMSGNSVSIPANGLRGWRSSISDRLFMDSDGVLNDDNANPMNVKGNILVVQSRQKLDEQNLPTGQVIFINYEALMTDDSSGNISSTAKQKLAEINPAAIVIVTRDSNEVNVNHGTFANEIGPVINERIPVIQVRSEDIRGGDFTGWDLINKAQSAEIAWDTDLLAPGTSHNLIVRIPGKDTSRAMILSAHIDSVGTPGAMDDGSGSATLLEVAHILEDARYQPAIDLYLAWFGSEELGLYGSANFVNTHQELLDRTVANLNVDCLSRPLDSVQANIQLAFWPGNWEDKDASPWVNDLGSIAQAAGIETHKMIINISSDNNVFDAYDVPNLDVIFDSDDEMNGIGGVWYGGHIHDPYDTVEKARDSSDALMKMANIALQGVLNLASSSNFRTSSAVKYSAMFIGTHTEPPLMTPTGMADFSTVLARSGFDVNLIPYHQTFSLADLKSANIVFVMPVADFPNQSTDLNLYDESWSSDEIKVLKDYAGGGGLLVITNSSQITGFYGNQQDDNEDWEKMNALSEAFGIKYVTPGMDESSSKMEPGTSLSNMVTSLDMMPGEAVGIHLNQGQTLSKSGTNILAALVPFGKGQVLALADLGMFASGYSGLLNEQFINNILDYAAAK